jgi:alkanesulfonate monooxygenase SsuD/methylene tetrahydromethanopterin reductase-like flavin-dependent oxidoreductase (luciferase family)
MARPKVIIQLYPMIPAAGEEGRKAMRPLGRNADLYHEALHGWMDIAHAAEELGVWGFSTIEHHLHSEGYEVGPNPGVLNAWWAGQLKRMHVGALGYVMATQDPIRVAEETAILDHITEGRYFVGMARGYQSRWANILGQWTETPATVSDGSENDERNRKIFEERAEMLLECWTKDEVELKGEFYEAPYPHDTGVVGYPARKIASEAGGFGEIDAEGNVRKICVVPKPYQDPHPPVMVAASKSVDSIRFCAKHGFIPVYFMQLDGIVKNAHVYVEESEKLGRKMVLGQNQNIVRWPHICESEMDYDRKLAEYDLDIYKNFYGPFFPQFPQEPDTDWIDNMKGSGVFIGGTVEQSIKAWQDIYDQVPAEYITLIWHYAQNPKEEVIEELEAFMTHVWPKLEVPDFG